MTVNLEKQNETDIPIQIFLNKESKSQNKINPLGYINSYFDFGDFDPDEHDWDYSGSEGVPALPTLEDLVELVEDNPNIFVGNYDESKIDPELIEKYEKTEVFISEVQLASFNKPKKSVSELDGGMDSKMTWNLDGKSITIDFNDGYMVKTGEINSNFDSMQGTFENTLGLKGEWSAKSKNTKPKKKELKNTTWKLVQSDGSEQQITFLDGGYFEYRNIDE